MADNLQPTDDDVYINAGDSYDTTYYPKPPEEQVQEIAEEQGVKAASYPVLGAIAAWFEEQIAKSPDITNIVVDSQTVNGVTYDRKVSIEAQVLAYQIFKGLMQDKFDEFKEYKFEDD